MTYKDGYDKLQAKYDGYITTINKRYDDEKTLIMSKEITEEYTIEMQLEELNLNESNRKEALRKNEEDRNAALDKYDADYRASMDSILNSKSGIDYGRIMEQIEDIDFPTPEPLDDETDTTETDKEGSADEQ